MQVNLAVSLPGITFLTDEPVVAAVQQVLVDENLLRNIMEFLPPSGRSLMARTCRHWYAVSEGVWRDFVRTGEACDWRGMDTETIRACVASLCEGRADMARIIRLTPGSVLSLPILRDLGRYFIHLEKIAGLSQAALYEYTGLGRTRIEHLPLLAVIPGGSTILHRAAVMGDDHLIHALMAAGGSVMTRDGHGDTPLQCLSGNVNINNILTCLVLMDYGAYLGNLDEESRLHLHNVALDCGQSYESMEEDIRELLEALEEADEAEDSWPGDRYAAFVDEDGAPRESNEGASSREGGGF